MRDWSDVRECAACGRAVLWDGDEQRWVHEWAGADHDAVPPAAHEVAPALVDVDDVLARLAATGGRTGAVVGELLDEAAAVAHGRLCPGRCNGRWRSSVRRAVEEVYEAAQRDRPVNDAVLLVQVEPRLGDPVWCDDDQAQVVTALGRLVNLAALVKVRGDGRLNAGSSDADGRQSSGAAPASPSPAHDLLDEHVRWAADEARRLAEVVGDGHGGPLPEDPRLTTSLGYLWTHAQTWLGGHPAAIEHAEQAGRAALRWERDLERATGQDLLVHRLPVRCPRCSARALTRKDGPDDTVECQRCSSRWDDDDYQRFVAEAAELRRQAQRAERLARRAACQAS